MQTDNLQLPPKSIEERALVFMAEGMDAIKAVEAAFNQEQDMILSLLSGSYLSKKGHFVAEIMTKSIYPALKNKL